LSVAADGALWRHQRQSRARRCYRGTLAATATFASARTVTLKSGGGIVDTAASRVTLSE
jgi:hypothetical protein